MVDFFVGKEAGAHGEKEARGAGGDKRDGDHKLNEGDPPFTSWDRPSVFSGLSSRFEETDDKNRSSVPRVPLPFSTLQRVSVCQRFLPSAKFLAGNLRA